MNSTQERRGSLNEKLPNLNRRSSSVSRISSSRENFYPQQRSEQQIIPVTSERSLRRVSREEIRDVSIYRPNNFLEEVEGSVQRVPLPKEITSGISHLDMSNRLREMEKKFLDLSASMDRRIQAFIEENPQKIIRHLRNCEEKDAQLWKESFQNQANIQNSVAGYKDDLQKNLDNINQALILINRRVDESEYRVVNVERGINNFETLKATKLFAIDSNKGITNDNPNNDMLSMEINIIKEALAQERQKRETFFNDVMQQYQEVFSIVSRTEGQVIGKVQKQREELNEQIRRSKEQQDRLDSIKLQKLLGDNDYLRSMFKMLESKVDEEINKRLHHEFENKEWISHKIGAFRDEIKSDERDLLEGEKRFAEQMHQSIASINTIIKNTKEQLEANIASTQTIFNQNIKNITETINTLKDNVYLKLSALDLGQLELKQKTQENQSHFHQHAQKTNEILDKELQRIEKVTLKFEEIMEHRLTAQDNKTKEAERQAEEWRKAFEDKNYKILIEMSNALKAKRNELLKEKKDTLERFEQTRKEIEVLKNENAKISNQLDSHVKTIQNQFEFRMKESSLRSSEDLKKELLQLTELINSNQNDINQKVTIQLSEAMHSLDKKLNFEFSEEVSKTKISISQDLKGIIIDVREDINNKLSGMNTTLKQYDNAKTQEVGEVKREIEAVRRDQEANSIKIFERLKEVRTRSESHLKLTIEAIKVQIGERLNEVRAEINDMSNYNSAKFQNEIDAVVAQTKSFLTELHNRVQEEQRLDLDKLDSRFIKFIEEERKIRSEKDSEILKQVNSVKNMLMETINTKIESTQAIARALVNEEAAERARAIDNILHSLSRRISAVEDSLRSLIYTCTEELRSEMKNRIRLLEINIEEHKLWTINELNRLVEDWEEYVNHMTVKFHVLELQSKAESHLTNQNFQKVDSEIDRIDNNRNRDVEFINKEFSRVKNDREQDHKDINIKFNEIEEQRKKDFALNKQNFRKIEEQRLQDVEKGDDMFLDIKKQRAEDMKRIESELEQIYSNREQDIVKLEQEVEERRNKNNEHEGVLEKANKELEIQRNELSTQKDLLEEHTNALSSTVKMIKDSSYQSTQQLIGAVKEIELKLNQLDEKHVTTMSDFQNKIQINDYIEKMYRKTKEEEEIQTNQEYKRRLQQHDEELKATSKRIDEVDRLHVAFEDKTESNFTIAEEMLKAHSTRLNELGSKIEVHGSSSKAGFDNLEGKVAAELANTNMQMQLSQTDFHERLEKAIQNVKKTVTQELIPSQVNLLRESVEEERRKLVDAQEQMQKLITINFEAQEKRIGQNKQTIEVQSQKIRFNDENIDVITDVLQKHTKRLEDAEAKLNKTKIEVGTAMESKLQALTEDQKNAEYNLNVTIQKETKAIRDLIGKIEAAPVKSTHMQEIRTTISNDINGSIRQIVPTMIDDQARKIMKDDVYKVLDNDVKKMIKDETGRLADQVVPRMLDTRIQQLSAQCHKMIEDQVPFIIQNKVPGIISEKAKELQKRQEEEIKTIQQEQKRQDQYITMIADKKIDKAEGSGITQRIKFIEDKISSENNLNIQKFKNFEEQFKDLEKQLGSNSQSNNKINDIRKEVSKLQETIDEVKKQAK